MNKLIICLLLIFCTSCKSKKKLDSTKAFVSIVDYLQTEVKRMDTLPLHFTKITGLDSTSDTVVVTKEEFHKYAKEFLDIPDIASPDKMDDYTETNDFDDILNNVLLIYTAKNENDEVRNETVIMRPDDSGDTHIKTFLVHTLKAKKDATVEKEMAWHIDKRFQIVTKLTKPNQPEKISTVIINWE